MYRSTVAPVRKGTVLRVPACGIHPVSIAKPKLIPGQTRTVLYTEGNVGMLRLFSSPVWVRPVQTGGEEGFSFFGAFLLPCT